MAHLHEVLAVDKELEAVAWKVVEEAAVTFTKKVDHFQGFDKRYEAFNEARQREVDGLNENKTLTTTVPEKLEYVAGHFIRFLDALAQKETTNQEARADIITPDGKFKFANVPATLLLALEGKLAKLRSIYEALPTLQPGVEWKLDPQIGKYVFRAMQPIVKQKTEKTPEFKVLYDATKEHPAQIEKWFADIPIAESRMTVWSGMISPAQKATLLRRLDDLVHAIKQARMRANEQEVSKIAIGAALFDYIHGDWAEQF